MNEELWYATTAPGLEDILMQELSYEGVEGTKHHGGVFFSASREQGAQLVLELFTPNKIRLLLKKAQIQGLSDINKALSSIQWKSIISAHVPVVIEVQTKHSRFFRTDIIRTKSERCMRSIIGDPKPDRQVQTIFLHIEKDELSIYIDAGGGLLHQRGWRTIQGKAPLRETYAASLLVASGWTPQEPLWDPLCGSGTIPIEAARMACGSTAGWKKRYPVEEWKLKKMVKHRKGKDAQYSIIGSDNHIPSIRIATELSDSCAPKVQWRHCSIDECIVEEKSGIFICNPPYGKRLGQHVDKVYEQLGALLESNPTWRATFIATDRRLAKKVSKRAKQYTKFSNGGLQAGIWFVPPQKEEKR